MPIFLIIVGLVLLVAAVKGNQKDLFATLKDDFTGSGNYFVWVIAVALIVMAGNIEKIRPVSNAFLWLVVIVIMLANKGLIPAFFSELKKGTGASGGQALTNGVSSGQVARQSLSTFVGRYIK